MNERTVTVNYHGKNGVGEDVFVLRFYNDGKLVQHWPTSKEAIGGYVALWITKAIVPH